MPSHCYHNCRVDKLRISAHTHTYILCTVIEKQQQHKTTAHTNKATREKNFKYQSNKIQTQYIDGAHAVTRKPTVFISARTAFYFCYALQLFGGCSEFISLAFQFLASSLPRWSFTIFSLLPLILFVLLANGESVCADCERYAAFVFVCVCLHSRRSKAERQSIDCQRNADEQNDERQEQCEKKKRIASVWLHWIILWRMTTINCTLFFISVCV